MDLDKIKAILELFEGTTASRLSIEEDGFRISMEKESSKVVYTMPEPAVVPLSNVSGQEAANIVNNVPVSTGFIVKAPLVGTFYQASAPGADPFVKVGSEVSEGDVICIIEAMKMINEIKSPVSGKVVKIFPKDGELVGFDDHIFEIEEN